MGRRSGLDAGEEVHVEYYDLTENEKSILTWMVQANQRGDLKDEFTILWTLGGNDIRGYSGYRVDMSWLKPHHLNALETEGLLRCERDIQKKTSTRGKKNPQIVEREKEMSRRCTLPRAAHKAVADDFVKPEPAPTSVFHQTNNFYAEVNYAAIGPHSHVELTQNLDLESVRKRIKEEGGEYADDLYELLELAESVSREGKTLEPGMLSKFNEAMQQCSWIVSPVVSLILGNLT